jgi:hypothetical protein
LDGGESGTTSRWHSFSVVQPQRKLVMQVLKLNAGMPARFGHWANMGGLDNNKFAVDLSMLALSSVPARTVTSFVIAPTLHTGAAQQLQPDT